MIAKSSLFHFTSELQTLAAIVTQRRFRACYNVEDISDFYPSEKYVGIPMVCFCDIPLKFVSEHPMGYGRYGIGLTKEWGLSAAINPVLYRSERCTVNQYLNEVIKTTKLRIGVLEKNTNTLDPTELATLNDLIRIQDKTLLISTFSKKYLTNDVINYLDREWRFVPKHSEIPFLKRKVQRTRLNNDYFNANPDYLEFHLRDIKYIIAPNKKEASKLIKTLVGLRISDSEKYQLAQLVIDLKSVKDDF